MAKEPENKFLSLLKKLPPVRYYGGQDQLAEQLIKILKSSISPVGVCLYGGAYDRLIDVTNRVGAIENGRKVYAAESASVTTCVTKLPRQERPGRALERSYSANPIDRLVGSFLSLECETVVIAGAEKFPKSQFSLLNAAVETLSKEKNHPKLLLIFEGPHERFDPLLNNGPIPWAVQICRPLTLQDIVGFLNLEGISVDENFLNDEAAMTLLAAACKFRPQGVKRLAIALTGCEIFTLTDKTLLEYLPLLDGTASLKHKSGPHIPSSRTRGRSKILRGQIELDL